MQKPFYPEGTDVCHNVILHTDGGIVGGDRLSVNFHPEPNAKALITTDAASKIYCSNGLQFTVGVVQGAVLHLECYTTASSNLG